MLCGQYRDVQSLQDSGNDNRVSLEFTVGFVNTNALGETRLPRPYQSVTSRRIHVLKDVV